VAYGVPISKKRKELSAPGNWPEGHRFLKEKKNPRKEEGRGRTPRKIIIRVKGPRGSLVDRE